MFKKSLSRWAVCASFLVPIDSADQWQSLEFKKIPLNSVEFKAEKLTVNVKSSASPLIFPLKQAVNVKGVRVKGSVNRLIAFKDPNQQGQKGIDDYIFRYGLVIPGEKTLNWATRMVAASWVKKLYSLAPKGMGLDHIYFLNLGQSQENHGRERTHPLSDLMKEKNEWIISQSGKFDLSADFQKPKPVAAIWLSMDGDDTKSEFQVEIEKLELILVDKN